MYVSLCFSLGLAWTAMGGEIMFVEAARMGGEGKLTLTGQLGMFSLFFTTLRPHFDSTKLSNTKRFAFIFRGCHEGVCTVGVKLA